MKDRLDQVILRAFQDRQDQPPFPPEQLAPFKVFMDEYLMAQGLVPNWTSPTRSKSLLIYPPTHVRMHG